MLTVELKRRCVMAGFGKSKGNAKGSNTIVTKSSTGKCNLNEAQLNRMISERAYFIWEEQGRPQGADFDIWLQAEKDICARMKKK